jgi:hypothetical protein
MMNLTTCYPILTVLHESKAGLQKAGLEVDDTNADNSLEVAAHLVHQAVRQTVHTNSPDGRISIKYPFGPGARFHGAIDAMMDALGARMGELHLNVSLPDGGVDAGVYGPRQVTFEISERPADEGTQAARPTWRAVAQEYIKEYEEFYGAKRREAEFGGPGEEGAPQ